MCNAADNSRADQSDGLRGITRIAGDRVIRTDHERTEWAHVVLKLLAQAGATVAPRVLVKAPPEELSFVRGLVPRRGTFEPWVSSAGALRRVGEMIREFHDLTAATALPPGCEVICHNDLSPSNTVYDPDRKRPMAFIDWDLAAPGVRVADVGHAAWQWLDLGPKADAAKAGQGLKTLTAAYGDLSAEAVLDAAVRWQEDTAAGIDDGAARDETLEALVEQGVPDDCRAAALWTCRHRALLLDVADRYEPAR